MCLNQGTEFESKPNKFYWKVMREIDGQLYPAYSNIEYSKINFTESNINIALDPNFGFHAFRTLAAARIERDDFVNKNFVIYKVATEDELVTHGLYTNFGTRNAEAAMFRTMKILEKVY